MTKFILSSWNNVKNICYYVLKFNIWLDLQMIHFFAYNSVGSSLYTILIIFYLGGGNYVNSSKVYIFCYLTSMGLVFSPLVSAFVFSGLMKVKTSREILCKFYSEEYIYSCIGGNSAWRILGVKIGLIVLVDGVMQVVQVHSNSYATDVYAESCRTRNVPIDPKVVGEIHLRPGGSRMLVEKVFGVFAAIGK
jgi:hypothetical protein